MIDAESLDTTERAVLAGALRDPEIREQLVGKATAEWFQSIAHRTVFDALSTIVRQQLPLDVPTLIVAARAGAASIADVPLDVDWLRESWKLSLTLESFEKTHLPELRRAYQTRSFQALGGALAERCESLGPTDVATWLQARVDAIMDVYEAAPIRRDAEVVAEVRAIGDESALGPLTGVGELDQVGFRLTPRKVTTIAGRPGHGKSSLGRQIAIGAAERGAGVVVFQLEEGDRGWQETRLAMMTGEPYHAIVTGRASQDAYGIFGAYGEAARDRPLYVVDSVPGMAAFDIVNSVRRHKRNDPRVTVAIIDQMQSVVGWRDAKRGEGRDMAPTRILDEIVRGCQALDVHVVALHQLNRDLEKGGRKREPQMSDLADTAFFEHKSDTVLFVYRPNYDPTAEEEGQPDDEAVLKFGKRRSFAKTRHLVRWDGPRTILGNWADPIVTRIKNEMREIIPFGDRS